MLKQADNIKALVFHLKSVAVSKYWEGLSVT